MVKRIAVLFTLSCIAVSVCFLIAGGAKALKPDDERNAAGGELRSVGKITEITERSFSVGGTNYRILPSTKIINGNFRELKIGDEVKVLGTGTGREEANAFRIRILHIETPDKKRSVQAAVVSLARDDDGKVVQFTLDNEMTFDIDPNLALTGRPDVTATANNLLEGLFLKVEYELYKVTVPSNAVGRAITLIALNKDRLSNGMVVDINIKKDLSNIIIEVFERVGNKVKRKLETVYWDDVTSLISKTMGMDGIDDLEYGETLNINGNRLSDGTMLASKVITTSYSEFCDVRSGTITGITRVNNGGITRLTLETRKGESYIYYVNSKSCFYFYDFDSFGQHPELATSFPTKYLYPGAKASIESLSPDSFSPVTVILRAFVVLPFCEVYGEVESSKANSFKIFGKKVKVMEWTKFIDFEVRPTSNFVRAGDEICAIFLKWRNKYLAADSVRLLNWDTENQIIGEILDILKKSQGVKLMICQYSIYVTDKTVIKSGKSKKDISFLEQGMNVQVDVEYDESGLLLANKIKILPAFDI